MAPEIIVALISAGVTVFNILITTIVSVVTKAQTKKAITKAAEDNKTQLIEKGLQALLRTEIIRSHEKQVTEKDYCPVYAKEALTTVYKVYHELGGNDVATKLYEELMDLPTEKIED